MPRIEEAIEMEEARAATLTCELAESIEELCYPDAQTVPAVTVRELHRAYRVLQKVTVFYFGENAPLVWTPPDGRFKAKEKDAAK
jgi:hypothetical protein